MYREVACWPLETPSEKHRLSGSKTPTKKGHLTKTHFTPLELWRTNALVRPTRRQRPHVHSAQRQFRFSCCCLADCKTRCSSLSRQTSLSNHIIHHIFRSVGFQNKILGWVITETETNMKTSAIQWKVYGSCRLPLSSFRGAGSSPLPVAPDQNFISKTAWSFSGCTSTSTLRCCAQNSVRDKDEQRTLWPTRWRCTLLFMQSRLHRHKSQSQRWQSFCFVFQNSAVGHVA